MTSNKKTVSLRVPDEVYGFLKVLANSENRSLSKQILTIIEEWVLIQKEEERIEKTPTVDGDIGDLYFKQKIYWNKWNDIDATGITKWVYNSPGNANISWLDNTLSGNIDLLGYKRSIDSSGNTTYSMTFTPITPGNDQLISNVIKSDEYDIRLMFKKKEEDND